MQYQLSRFLSQKFRFYTFISIALLLYVHSYNLNETYLTPYSTVKEPLTFTTFFEYFISNGILRFRIPMLFLISGYIYALLDKRPYTLRLQKRFRTLIIPYFIWSAVGLAITFLWQQSDLTSQALYLARLDPLGDNRPYTEIGWPGILYRWIAKPVSFQLWFLRSLFLYNILYPVFRWAVLKIPYIWFPLLGFFWIITSDLWSLFEGQGMLFFSIGIWLSKRNYPIERKPPWLSLFLAWAYFIGLCIAKTFMAFELEVDSQLTLWMLRLFYFSAIIVGILAVWFGLDRLVQWCMNRKWFRWISSFSFVIFGLHVPLVIYVSKLAYIFIGQLAIHRLLIYLLVPVFVLVFCIGLGALLRRVLPPVYRLATGGRGF